MLRSKLIAKTDYIAFLKSLNLKSCSAEYLFLIKKSFIFIRSASNTLPQTTDWDERGIFSLMVNVIITVSMDISESTRPSHMGTLLSNHIFGNLSAFTRSWAQIGIIIEPNLVSLSQKIPFVYFRTIVN